MSGLRLFFVEVAQTVSS